jgi:hypothetical protein
MLCEISTRVGRHASSLFPVLSFAVSHCGIALCCANSLLQVYPCRFQYRHAIPSLL